MNNSKFHLFQLISLSVLFLFITINISFGLSSPPATDNPSEKIELKRGDPGYLYNLFKNRRLHRNNNFKKQKSKSIIQKSLISTNTTSKVNRLSLLDRLKKFRNRFKTNQHLSPEKTPKTTEVNKKAAPSYMNYLNYLRSRNSQKKKYTKTKYNIKTDINSKNIIEKNIIKVPEIISKSFPNNVENLQVILINNFSVELSWDAVNNANNYKIYYGNNSVQLPTDSYDYEIEISNQTSYNINNLIAGTTYYFAIIAINNEGEESSNYSEEISITIPSVNEIQPLTANRTDGLGNSPIKIEEGTNNLKIVEFEINNPNNQSIAIDKLQFWTSSGNLFDYTVNLYSNSSIFNKQDDDSLPGGFHFDNLNIIIPANGKHTFSIVVDITANGIGQVFKISLNGINFNISGVSHQTYGSEVSLDSAKIWVIESNNNFSSQSIGLHTGWNIISLYINPEDTSIESVFSELINTDSLLQTKDTFNFFDPSLPGFLNTLDTIEAAKGYWVKVNKNITLDVNGEAISLPFTYNLNTGWNLIGYPLSEPANMFCILYNLINNNLLTDISKEPLAGEISPEKIVENSQWNSSNMSEQFEPGEGYWIKVNTPTQLEIINTTPCLQ